jgi:hypothetical protein
VLVFVDLEGAGQVMIVGSKSDFSGKAALEIFGGVPDLGEPGTGEWLEPYPSSAVRAGRVPESELHRKQHVGRQFFPGLEASVLDVRSDRLEPGCGLLCHQRDEPMTKISQSESRSVEAFADVISRVGSRGRGYNSRLLSESSENR